MANTHNGNRRNSMKMLSDSPVESRRKNMPRGNGDWPGFEKCYERLQSAAIYLSGSAHTHLNHDHIDVMAAMGSGDEETMKYYMHLAYMYKWI